MPALNDQGFGTNLREIFSRALASTTGAVLIHCSSRSAAEALRFRMYSCRVRERKMLAKTYGPDTPCAWDRLVLTVEGHSLKITQADVFDKIVDIVDSTP